MNKRRLLSILTCLALCLTLLPTAALAAAVGETIHVGGVELTTTEGNPTVYAKTDDNGVVSTTNADENDYTIMWDGETLTLNNADITQGSYKGAAIYCGEDAGIHLVLVGESTVTGPSGDSTGASYGIYTGGELTISGSGILNVSGGILNVSGGNIAASSNGLFVNGNLTISGGTVHATGGEVSGEYAY
ncbi:MAG TPA: carbohydrate-binding domain-containing protein, partial [Candidatus Oscillibacter avistercoris]|nr:carbohydrate-binding domain-containing protein [Candidatus Oscillibacter avistercoris]